MDPIATHSIYRPPRVHPTEPKRQNIVTKPGAFQSQFQQELNKTENGLRLSKHAEQRMIERQIKISPEKWATIDQKVNEAKSMGITDSLVLTNKEAMVVNAKNKTVITVMNRTEATKHIFSNINGTIVLD